MIELTISEASDVKVEGPVTIELPSYMRALPQHEVDEACASGEACDLIVAAGRHPNGDVLFVTADGAIRSLDHVKEALPPGAAAPIACGQTLGIAVPGLSHAYEISARYAITRSTVLLGTTSIERSAGRARVSYLDE